MYKKKIRYVDYFGNVREEEYLFNIDKSEMIQLELDTPGGLKNTLTKIVDKQDIPSLSDFVNRLIKMSYGVVSPDGRKFVKTNEVWEDFRFSAAYDALYTEIITSDDKMTEFIANVFPNDENKPEINDSNIVAIEKAKAMIASQNK